MPIYFFCIQKNFMQTKKFLKNLCHLGFQITIYIHLQILHLFCIQNIYFQSHYKTIVVLMLSSKKKKWIFPTSKMLLFLQRSNRCNNIQKTCCPCDLLSTSPESAKRQISFNFPPKIKRRSDILCLIEDCTYVSSANTPMC